MRRSKAGWWRDYSEFLRSPRWAAVRREVLQRDSCRCQYCGRRAEHVHHLAYHGDWADPRLLVSICAACHSRLHGRALTNPRQATARVETRSKWNFCRRWLATFFRFLR
jgi:5-methylcytosine-specific restriction endonuclease McrA